MKTFFTLTLAILSTVAFSQQLTTNSAISAGGTLDDEGTAVAVDASGNIYIAGNFQQTAYIGSDSVVASGGEDLVVAKLDMSGQVQWATAIGGSSDDHAFDIAVDAQGNVYIGGSFEGTVSAGTVSLTSSGGLDAFAIKLNSLGNATWGVSGGGADDDEILALEVDGLGNVYATGYYNSTTAQFGSQSLVNLGGSDAFFLAVTATGSISLAIGMGGLDDQVAKDIHFSSATEVIISGSFDNSIMLGTVNLTASGEANFVAKINLTGTVSWAEAIPGNYDAEVDVATDASGNIYFISTFSGSQTIGTSTVTSAGGDDVLVVKMDGSGNVNWAVSAGGSANDEGVAVTISDGNIFLAGNFEGTADFDAHSVTSVGASDNFVAVIDQNGSFKAVLKGGGSLEEEVTGMAADANGGVAVIGSFEGSGTFKTTPATLTSNGGKDMYLWRVNAPSSGVEYTGNLSVRAFPNPLQNEFYLSIEKDGPHTVSVYSLSGELVKAVETTGTQVRVEMNVQPGIYFIDIDGEASLRVVKQ